MRCVNFVESYVLAKPVTWRVKDCSIFDVSESAGRVQLPPLRLLSGVIMVESLAFRGPVPIWCGE